MYIYVYVYVYIILCYIMLNYIILYYTNIKYTWWGVPLVLSQLSHAMPGRISPQRHRGLLAAAVPGRASGAADGGGGHGSSGFHRARLEGPGAGAGAKRRLGWGKV